MPSKGQVRAGLNVQVAAEDRNLSSGEFQDDAVRRVEFRPIEHVVAERRDVAVTTTDFKRDRRIAMLLSERDPGTSIVSSSFGGDCSVPFRALRYLSRTSVALIGQVGV